MGNLNVIMREHAWETQTEGILENNWPVFL